MSGAGSGATSAARRCPPLARPSAYRSPPRFRPLGRRLSSLGPGSGTPCRPPSLQGARAPGALGAEPSARQPRHGCGWAPRHRDAPLQPRAALLRAEPGRRGRLAVGERGGGRAAAGAEARWREEETATSPEPRAARMGRGNGDPSRCGTPASGPPRFLALLLSEDSRCRPSAPLGPEATYPLPCQASLASTCSSF